MICGDLTDIAVSPLRRWLCVPSRPPPSHPGRPAPGHVPGDPVMPEHRDPIPTVGERIRRHRVRAGLSRAKLGDLIGRSQSWVFKVEAGDLRPDRLSVLVELARVLNIDVAELAETSEEEAAAAVMAARGGPPPSSGQTGTAPLPPAAEDGPTRPHQVWPPTIPTERTGQPGVTVVPDEAASPLGILPATGSPTTRRKGKRVALPFALVGGVLTLAALGAGLVHGGRAPNPRTGSACAAAGGASGTVGASQPRFLPDQDTPIEAAAPWLQSLWRQYDVTQIPGRRVAESIPVPPPVRNLTLGAVCDRDAQLWLRADYRSSAYFGWLTANRQVGLDRHLHEDVFLTGKVGEEVRAGDQVIYDPCYLYAARAALVPVDDQLQHLLMADQQPTTTARYALVEYLAAPCSTTDIAPGKPARRDVSTKPETIIEPGVLRNDPLLGDIWYSEALYVCPSPASGICLTPFG
jgi:DNA-binding XRE family transcriptional regulator